jgi:hypothetical protein
MTATPIPRTLAMTLYGDLDVSVIDELPPGRKPIRTIHQFDAHRRTLNEHIRRQIQLGRQVYIVYPLIKESEKMDIKNLEAGFAQVKTDFPECSVSMVHGKLKPAEKDAEMQRFVRGETQIMVATTVIEVGVNVPNASVMVIENAERFGLSQLHQLRGRVGRGAEQSFCILVTKYQLSDVTRKRIQVMVDSNDGFEIAEQDLKLRGPGDLEGTQQSGMAFNLRIANLAKDGILLQMARNEAAALLDADPAENHPRTPSPGSACSSCARPTSTGAPSPDAVPLRPVGPARSAPPSAASVAAGRARLASRRPSRQLAKAFSPICEGLLAEKRLRSFSVSTAFDFSFECTRSDHRLCQFSASAAPARLFRRRRFVLQFGYLPDGENDRAVFCWSLRPLGEGAGLCGEFSRRRGARGSRVFSVD